MDKETLKALEGSIEKWEKIIDKKGEDRGSSNCPLCLLFVGYEEEECVLPDGSRKRCPLEKKGDGCSNIAYMNWCSHLRDQHSKKPRSVQCKTCVELAKQELKYLKSFLPKKRK